MSYVLKYQTVKALIRLLLMEQSDMGLDFLFSLLVRGDRDSRANLMPIYGDLYQIKL